MDARGPSPFGKPLQHQFCYALIAPDSAEIHAFGWTGPIGVGSHHRLVIQASSAEDGWTRIDTVEAGYPEGGLPE